MRVSELMTANPSYCLPRSSLQEVARLMLDKDCGAIPVVETGDSRHPVGMITDRDITINAVALGKDPSRTTVGEIMTFPAITVQVDSEVDACLKKMEERQVRRMIVVDDTGLCCGIVAQADVARRGRPEETAELVQDISVAGAAVS